MHAMTKMEQRFSRFLNERRQKGKDLREKGNTKKLVL